MNEPVNILLHSYSVRFQFLHRPEFDVFCFIELASQLGFQGVAISANDESYRHLASKEPAQFAKIRQHLEQHQLLSDLDTSGTEPQHLKRMLSVARQIGARHLRTYTRYPYSQALGQTIADLRQVGAYAEAVGVKILLENHELFSGADIAEIVARVNHPFVQALFDYGNSQMVLEDPLVALASMLPFAGSAHVKDHVIYPAPNGDHASARVLGVPLGRGHLPIRQLTNALYQSGLREFVFEDSRGYHAPFKPERQTSETLAQLGHDSFAYAHPPFDNERYWIATEDLSPKLLVKEELATLLASWLWLQRLFTDLEIPLNQ